jgi:hypothetical protein
MLVSNLQVNTAAARELTWRNLPHHPTLQFQGFIACSRLSAGPLVMEVTMNGIIYLIGLVVVILFLLSLLGLR